MTDFYKVKDAFEKRIRSGTGIKCPCCRRWAQVYKYSFHGGMMKALGFIYHAHASGQFKWDEYFHVENYFVDIGVKIKGSHGKLKYWDLIESRGKKEDEDYKKWSGFWRITQKGVDFVRREISVPKYALLFNDQCEGLIGDEIYYDLKTAPFHYKEMMESERSHV